MMPRQCLPMRCRVPSMPRIGYELGTSTESVKLNTPPLHGVHGAGLLVPAASTPCAHCCSACLSSKALLVNIAYSFKVSPSHNSRVLARHLRQV